MEIISFLPTVIFIFFVFAIVFNDDFTIKIVPKRDRRGRYINGHEKIIYRISKARHVIKLKQFVLLSIVIALLNLIIYLINLW